MDCDQECYPYWGKAIAEIGEEIQWHLLAYHSLDVAAVAQQLLKQMPRWRSLLARLLNLDEERVVKLICFLVSIHDVGKFSHHFQIMARLVRAALQPGVASPSNSTRARHDVMGYQFCDEFLPSLVSDHLVAGDQACDFQAESLMPLVQAVTGHHGQPPDLGKCVYDIDQFFSETDIKAAQAFTRFCLHHFDPDFSFLNNIDEEDVHQMQQIKTASFLLAGLTILCDWLGSNKGYFPYQDQKMPLEHYFESTMASAALAVEKTLLVPPPPRAESGMAGLFPEYNPSYLQEKVSSLEINPGPNLLIVEDLTGSGKTEAALVLAHRLMKEANAEGLIFALPSMATADQMYDRVAAACSKLFQVEQRSAALVLGHGTRHLSAGFQATIGLEEKALEGEQTDGLETASATCSSWLADSTKKALLGTLGVCTVDQVMLAVLRSKHHALRLIGLSNKVLIIDEVHAYDAYMRQVLTHLIQFQAAFGGHCILLSATLPENMRTQLVNGWRMGVGLGLCQALDQTPYPMITHCSPSQQKGLVIDLSENSARRSRTFGVQLVHQEPDDLIVDLACEGRCVCWIRNTVDDCIQAYQRLGIRPEVDKDRLVLFHARFPMGRRLEIQQDLLSRFGKNGLASGRKGWIVIATQVVEQSLDIDFDRVISDLAPIDLLIQRLGRQQRHARNPEGQRLNKGMADERGLPLFTLYGPPWDENPDQNWYKNFFPRAQYVYPETHQLWLTQKALMPESGETCATFHFPADARPLIEAVYGNHPLPEGLADAEIKILGKEYGDKNGASQSCLNLASGYANERSYLDPEQIQTRLGPPSITLRLLAWDGARLSRMCGLEPDPWELNDVRVNASRINQICPDQDLDAALSQLSKQIPGKNKQVLPVPMVKEGSVWVARGLKKVAEVLTPVTLVYSAEEGLAFNND